MEELKDEVKELCQKIEEKDTDTKHRREPLKGGEQGHRDIRKERRPQAAWAHTFPNSCFRVSRDGIRSAPKHTIRSGQEEGGREGREPMRSMGQGFTASTPSLEGPGAAPPALEGR